MQNELKVSLIRSADKNLIKNIDRIYVASFVPDERRESIMPLVYDTRIKIYALFIDEQLIGFMNFWKIEESLFLEHIAIDEKMRNRKLGSQAFDYLFSQIKKGVAKNVVLEAERPETGKIAEKRLNYYRRLGFQINLEKYVQPAYEKAKNPVPMSILSYPEKLTFEYFRQITKQIHKIVYNLSESKS